MTSFFSSLRVVGLKGMSEPWLTEPLGGETRLSLEAVRVWTFCFVWAFELATGS